MTEASVNPALLWRRLHPATLLLAILRLGPRSINMLPALAAIGIAGRWAYVLPALALFLLLSLGGAWLAWWRFRYRIGDDEVVIESGIFSRQHRTIPFDRIQDASIEQGLVARVLDVAKLALETGAGGGGKSDEAKLDAISLAEAQALRGAIRAHRHPAPSLASADAPASTTTAGAPISAYPLFTMSPPQLVRAGMFNFSLAALAAVFAGTQFFDSFLPFNYFNPGDWVDILAYFGLDEWILLHRSFAAVAALASLLLIGFVSGIATMFLANWNFRLTREPRALRRTRGLATRTDVALPLARIQAAIIRAGWLQRYFGWHELRVQSLARDGEKERDHQLIPFGRMDDVRRVLDEMKISAPPADTVWHKPHPIIALGGLIGALGAVAGGSIALILGSPLGWLGIAASLAIAAADLFTIRHHRWADLGGVLAIRRGFWKPRMTLLPFTSVQSVDLESSALRRRLGLASLLFGVPGGSSLGTHAIPAIPHNMALELRQRILAARTERGA